MHLMVPVIRRPPTLGQLPGLFGASRYHWHMFWSNIGGHCICCNTQIDEGSHFTLYILFKRAAGSKNYNHIFIFAYIRMSGILPTKSSEKADAPDHGNQTRDLVSNGLLLSSKFHVSKRIFKVR